MATLSGIVLCMLPWLLYGCYCPWPRQVTGQKGPLIWHILSIFVFLLISRGVIRNWWERGWWWTVLKGEVTVLRGDYQWVSKGSLLKLIWINTVLSHNESMIVSKRYTCSRSGKYCWFRERAEDFIETWGTLSTGVVRSGVKSSGIEM